jgi:hypothetical protein
MHKMGELATVAAREGGIYWTVDIVAVACECHRKEYLGMILIVTKK